MTNSTLTAYDLRKRMLQDARIRRYAEFEIDGFGTVRIQSLTERERASIEKQAGGDDFCYRASLIALAVVDSNGDRVFSDADVDQLAEADCQITIALSDAVIAHVGAMQFTQQGIEAAVKNCEATQPDAVPYG